MSKIAETLTKRFEKHRIIFWYDENQELFEQYSQIQIPGVETIQVDGNEFAVKHRIVKAQPTQKFLLYFHHPKPSNAQNWLLDQELAHHVFFTDQEALFIQELGLEMHFKDLVSSHIEFFKAKERVTKLKELLGKGDDYQEIRYKMLAIVFGTEHLSLSTFIQAYGTAFVQESDRYEKELERFNLHEYFWKEIARKYKYQSDTPSIYDFLLEAFNNSFILGKKTAMAKEARLLLSLWKNTLPYRDHFSALSKRVAKDLSIEEALQTASIDVIVNDELFELTDMKLIAELAQGITDESLRSDRVLDVAKERENKFWYEQYRSLYEALLFASQMIQLVRQHQNQEYTDFSKGIEAYAAKLYMIDQLYRKFIYAFRKTSQNKILSSLNAKVEKIYANDWLLAHNNKWQKVIDQLSSWPKSLERSQASFFKVYVEPFVQKKQRLFVIISDAFRYECGAELAKTILAENRFEASIKPMVSLVPSYTQLGMAALLPHKQLKWQDGTDQVLVDGLSSVGTTARGKILEKNSNTRATAITAEDFMRMNSSTEGRDFVKQYDLIYIYHNRIDKTGDDKTSEDKVFEAVKDEQNFLLELLRKIYAMNGNNMVITSDHGFLYQNKAIDESDFSIASYKGELWKENRRFVIGQNLHYDSNSKCFSAESLGYNADVLIPKSINRLRVKGAGSRFIHGGASLQELVIPAIRVSVKRKDTTTQVDVDLIKSTDRITTNILAVSFVQSEPVSEKVLPRILRAYLAAKDGTMLSDIFTYTFDTAESSAFHREVKHRFQLESIASGQYKNQAISLILEEPVDASSQWKRYKDFNYTLNISFTSDFDEI